MACRPGYTRAPTLYAISLWQPWASAIIAGPKRYENRTWALGGPYPRWLAVHAGKRTDPGLRRRVPGHRCRSYWAELADLWPACPGSAAGVYPRGILGLMRIDGVVSAETTSDPWASGPLCWEIGAAVALESPIACPGHQGLWRVQEEHLVPLREAYRAWRDLSSP